MFFTGYEVVSVCAAIPVCTICCVGCCVGGEAKVYPEVVMSPPAVQEVV